MTASILAAVVVTVYVAPVGTPLYCDRGQGLVYGDGYEWIAWDFAVHGGQCGDTITVWSGGVMRQFQALDSGAFGRYCVEWDGECLPIAADIPRHAAWFDGLSARATVVNTSEAKRCLGAAISQP